MSTITEKHAVVYLDDSGYWNVGFVADYDNAKDTARRWRERLTGLSHNGKIMICRLVETIEWCNR